ncbi:unnamed protein product [Pleuronectes platessa]|uniref:Uncharacterized protein n=1 Tax=Pleuronectes platessa TaxID=8262 RepID=A0A9N7YTU9_PLEPL|nr:unnamed protein product [Pleuronectes platessa]
MKADSRASRKHHRHEKLIEKQKKELNIEDPASSSSCSPFPQPSLPPSLAEPPFPPSIPPSHFNLPLSRCMDNEQAPLCDFVDARLFVSLDLRASRGPEKAQMCLL